jgi:hypothetical protein
MSRVAMLPGKTHLWSVVTFVFLRFPHTPSTYIFNISKTRNTRSLNVNLNA